ncbi:hypothetical protein [Gemmatimonas sp.]|uniref:hypothetical protein n=1 Tax=Gemmatimonas sp. TaxID=1962908 RepID=UPI0039838A5F
MNRPIVLAILVVSLTGACTPYAVTTTARPLARGENMRTTTLTVVPAGAQFYADSADRKRASVAMPGLDIEQRFGLDDRSDWGIRIPSMSGVIVSYKRRLDGPSARDGRATALMLGGGMVNLGQHAHVDVTLLTSGRESASWIPYGGVRALQVIPLSSIAVRDTPAVGAFGGVRTGGSDHGFSFELGVFYDESALKLRRNTIIIVPSIAMHGGAFRRLLPW